METQNTSGFCWKKKNDVAKMRQAGTAPATGATICCLSSLLCIVTYKLLALCTANTLLRANVCLALRSDLCLSDLMCHLWMHWEIRSFGAFVVRHSIGARSS